MTLMGKMAFFLMEPKVSLFSFIYFCALFKKFLQIPKVMKIFFMFASRNCLRLFGAVIVLLLVFMFAHMERFLLALRDSLSKGNTEPLNIRQK